MSTRSKFVGNRGVVGAGVSNGSERQKDDYYTTGDGAIAQLEEVYQLPKKVWECACGSGALSRQLEANKHTVYSSDKYRYGYGKSGVDFLNTSQMPQGYDCIVTNPPFSLAVDFIKHGLSLVSKRKGVVAMFLKLAFLESQSRYDNLFYDNPPTYLFPFVNRIQCYKDDDRDAIHGSMMPFAWFVWDNAVKSDAPQIYWI